MKIWTRLEDFFSDPGRPLVLALGNFDGVHLGHQQILKKAAACARESGGISSVLTFYEHPQRVLRQTGKPALLTSPQHRLSFFYELGIEVCFLLHFTLEFSKIPPGEFVETWLVKRLGAREIHLGYNAHFGAGRKGDAALMRNLAKKLKFDFHEAAPVRILGEYVSSTLIRRSIAEGDLWRASQFLGRPFTVQATVVRGRGRGTEIGFPTANLRPHTEMLPPPGVYPGEIRESAYHLKPIPTTRALEYRREPPCPWRPGVLNYGVRPTFGEGAAELVPEVHVLDFDGELYGRTVEVRFHPRLRAEERFDSPDALRHAIQKDVESTRRYFEK